MRVLSTACNCSALREAARRLTQFYDQSLARAGLRTTQYAVLARLARLGQMTIARLAEEMVMDRTTLGRNILPLERDGLISIVAGKHDRRRRELALTKAGLRRLRNEAALWAQAQQRFEAIYGPDRSRQLRQLAGAVVAALPAGQSPGR